MMKHAFILSLLSIVTLMHSSSAAESSPCVDGETPQIKVNLKKDADHVLYVCGFENTEHTAARGYKSLSEMKIFSVKESEEPKLMLETTALETHWVKKDKGELILDEVWWVNTKPSPALRTEITCKKKGCKASRPKCVFGESDKDKKKKTVAKKPKKPKKDEKKPVDPLVALQQALKDPTAHPDFSFQEATSQIFVRALKGNRKAQSFFFEARMPASFEGDSADEWQAAKAQLRRAKKYGCMR